MSKVLERFGLLAMLFLFFSVAALPAPSKIAIIKVNSGTATLDDIAIDKATLAGEGQLLVLAKGTEVRVQLLGSKSEFTLKDDARLIISRESLQAEATDVMNRNSVSVAKDIGNKNSTTASVTRNTGVIEDPVALNPIIPPRLDGNQKRYWLKFDLETPYKLRPKEAITIGIIPAGDGNRINETYDHSRPLKPLEITADDIEPGLGYHLSIIYHTADGGSHTYRTNFRILLPEQEKFLEQAQAELLKEYRASAMENVLPLLRLASLYQDYDQNDKALYYLTLAQSRSQDADEKESLQLTIETMTEGLRMPLPTPVATKNQ
jgi:hypothetical protein